MQTYMSGEVVIPLSKGKNVLLLFGAVAFVVGSIWLWSIADAQRRYHPLVVRVTSVVGTLFFGGCAIYGVWKLFDDRPGLVIDTTGILDNSSAVATGKIPWEDVLGIGQFEISGQRYIVVFVTEPEKYVRRGNYVCRMLKAANVKLAGSPITISPSSLQTSFDQLLQALTSGFERYGSLSESEPLVSPKFGARQGCGTNLEN